MLIKAFLCLVFCDIGFVSTFSAIAHPLNQLLKKNLLFRGCTECECAFYTFKNKMTSGRVLTNFNHKLPLVLATDTSLYGISAILSRTMPDNSGKSITFVSRIL